MRRRPYSHRRPPDRGAVPPPEGIVEGEILHCRGAVPAILDIQAGRADFAWSTVPKAIQAMRAGQTRRIAITAARRIEALPVWHQK